MSILRENIGVLGGSFDPPHLGHLIAAQYAAEQLGLQKIIFVPTGLHPFKAGKTVASPAQRFAMTKLAVAGNQLFEVSDFEIRSESTSYTIDTLDELRTQYPDARFCLLVGKDNVVDFHTWKESKKIIDTASVVVMDRVTNKEHYPDELTVSFLYLDTPTVEISSTEIRTRISENKSVRYLIRNGVELFIDMMGLYR